MTWVRRSLQWPPSASLLLIPARLTHEVLSLEGSTPSQAPAFSSVLRKNSKTLKNRRDFRGNPSQCPPGWTGLRFPSCCLCTQDRVLAISGGSLFCWGDSFGDIC